MGLALGLALLTPLLSRPVFAFGSWDKAEPMVAWFHLTAGLVSLCIGVIAVRRPQATLSRISHPFVIAPLAVALWSALTSPFVAEPWLSLSGTPQSGLGALWFLDQASFCAGFLLIRDHVPTRRRLIGGALAITVIVAGLKFWDWVSLERDGSHLLLFVAAYYGWLALALPILCAAGWCLAAGAAVVAASHSVTAMGIYGLEVVLIAVFRRVMPSRGAMTALILAAAIVPLWAINFVPVLWHSESLRDRHLIGQMAGAAIAADSLPWLVGHGWGRMQDALQTWTNLSGERLWSPTWIFLTSDYFSSHNWALDAIHAVGVPGAILVMLTLGSIPFYARSDLRPQALALALCLLIFHGLWFQLPLSIPVTAMALAFLADECRVVGTRYRLAALGPVLAGLIQLTVSAGLLTYGLTLSQARDEIRRSDAIPSDWRGSDLAAAEMMRDGLDHPAAAFPIQPWLEFLDRRVSASPTLPLIITGLTLMAQIHVTADHPDWARTDDLQRWEGWLDHLLALAPDRTDQAIPFLTFAIDQDLWDRVEIVSRHILGHNADDPVGLYSLGLVRLHHHDNGLPLIRQALDNGMERYMPIDPAVRAALH